MKQLILFIATTLILSCNKNGERNNLEATLPISISNASLNHVEPPNWWIGMKNTKLQLLVHDNDIGSYKPIISYSGILIDSVHKANSPNYLFLDLTISENTNPGKFDILFKTEGGDEKRHTYEIKTRRKPRENYVGFNSSDVIYLITPDRFANGNPANDVNDDLLEKTIDRNDDYARHGGDIQGITDHLDYINTMGFTAIWSTPLLVNDMSKASYHGYAITDYYKIDPRFGTFEEYLDLANKSMEKGIKLIMDQVANHCGLGHWWMQDLPFTDWVNYQKGFENGEETIYSNHKRTTNQDIYASKKDKEEMTDGWFVSTMPDLNQRNSFMANYITQNSIWWIETFGLDGIRQDTYPYPDKEFMSYWAGAIMNEYPNFTIVGEEWSYNPLLIGYWQDGANNKDGYDSNLKSTMDFAMQRKIVEALNEKETWDKGLAKIYEGLANDFHYVSPKDIMIFPDNHDMSRIFTQLMGDVTNTKMALACILSLPRTPQIYYGTEILMNDFEKPGDHGLVRTDFPGGWEEDTVSAFTGDGLGEDQKEMQSFLKKLLNYRKNSEAIHKGETVHFSPKSGTYFLFRKNTSETVVVILNKNDKPVTIDLTRYAEMGLKGMKLRNIITEESIVWDDKMTLNKKGCLILSTKE